MMECINCIAQKSCVFFVFVFLTLAGVTVKMIGNKQEQVMRPRIPSSTLKICHLSANTCKFATETKLLCLTVFLPIFSQRIQNKKQHTSFVLIVNG